MIRTRFASFCLPLEEGSRTRRNIGAQLGAVVVALTVVLVRGGEGARWSGHREVLSFAPAIVNQ